MVAKHIKRHISSYNVIERGVNVAAAESNGYMTLLRLICG